MALRLFADHCISNFIIQALRDADHDVFRLADHIPRDSADFDVISKAQELDSILISLNGDFADIVAYPPSKYKGIIALQVRNHPEVIPQLLEKLKEFITAHRGKVWRINMDVSGCGEFFLCLILSLFVRF